MPEDGKVDEPRIPRRTFVKRMAAIGFAVPAITTFSMYGLSSVAAKPLDLSNPIQNFPNQLMPNQFFGNQFIPNQYFPNQSFPNQYFSNQF